jgi:DNA invertase Pin-like site-specific DNA recombinase
LLQVLTKTKEARVRVVGYVRVSTKQQTLGDSLEAQEKAIREWAEAAGHVVVRIVEDGGESGKLPEDQRPGLLAALSILEAGEADGLAVQRLDRLARALHVQEAVLARAWLSEAEVWEAVGARLVLQDDPDDPMRTLVRQVMGAANQLEASMVAARLRGGRRHKEGRGGYGGGFVRYGWAVVGRGKEARLVEVEEEQAALRRIRRLRKRHTLRGIAAKLNAEGVPAKGGGPWRHTSVRSALRHAP